MKLDLLDYILIELHYSLEVINHLEPLLVPQTELLVYQEEVMEKYKKESRRKDSRGGFLD